MWRDADMFRLYSIKKTICTANVRYWLAGFFLLGIVLFTACMVPVMAEETKKSGINFCHLCDEDEYVLLSAGSNYAEIYDSKGNFKGRCRAALDRAATIKKDFVIGYMSGETWFIFSMAELKNILEFPAEEYSVETYEDVCLAVNRNTGKFSLYDCHGNLMYISNEREWAEGQYQGQIIGLDSGYLMCVCRSDETVRIPAIGPVWVSRDGKDNKVITAQNLIQGFVDWSIQDFGDYVFVYDSELYEGAVYDLDGNILLGHLFNALAPYTEDKWFYGYNYFIPAALVLQKADGMYIAYDTELQEVSMFPAGDDGFPDCGYAGGFLKGAAYEQLGGKVCAGFLRYQDETWHPYAKTEKGYLVYADGQLLEFPMDLDLTPWYFNETYITASHYGDDGYGEFLIDRKTGEILQKNYWEEGSGVSFELGGDFCIITETNWEDDIYSSSFSILDENKEVCYSQEQGSAVSWENGYIVLTRGVYHGIADREGNWIVRTIFGQDE